MGTQSVGVMVELSAPGATTLKVVVSQPLVVGREGDGLRISDAKVSRRHIEVRPDGAGTERSGVDTMTTIDSLAREATGDDASLREMLRRGGTITVMFSDIADSTRLATEMGDEAWFAVLQDHDHLVRGAVGEADGRVIKAQGDGFMASFTSASKAVVCAIRIQQAIETDGGDLRVRIGLHTGDAIELDDGDWIGRHVITASRIADSADGGQIHASDLVYELTRSLPDMPFGSATIVELKGLGQVVIRPVLWSGFGG